jgi:hypothetical protein
LHPSTSESGLSDTLSENQPYQTVWTPRNR